MQVNYLFSVAVPKVLVLYAHWDRAAHSAAQETALPLAKKYLGLVKVRPLVWCLL